VTRVLPCSDREVVTSSAFHDCSGKICTSSTPTREGKGRSPDCQSTLDVLQRPPMPSELKAVFEWSISPYHLLSWVDNLSFRFRISVWQSQEKGILPFDAMCQALSGLSNCLNTRSPVTRRMLTELESGLWRWLVGLCCSPSRGG
jgi:hypothetical protein